MTIRKEIRVPSREETVQYHKDINRLRIGNIRQHKIKRFVNRVRRYELKYPDYKEWFYA